MQAIKKIKSNFQHFKKRINIKNIMMKYKSMTY